MKVFIATPARRGSRGGNRVTALRWTAQLRSLGHRVRLAEFYDSSACDLLVALHARKSFPSVERYRASAPAGPLVVALTGTDVYGELDAPETVRSLALADRLIVLQPLAALELSEALRGKARVIYQSLPSPAERAAPPADHFEVLVLGHLRAVKDPLLTARAARLLPPSSRIRVTHLGGAIGEEFARAARAEAEESSRYRWLGLVPRRQALETLGRSHLLSLTSKMEGGANAISEAIAYGVPVVSSDIPGSRGLLGADYPGFFPVGDVGRLAALLRRFEEDRAFRADLEARCASLLPLVDPARERAAWKELLEEMTQRSSR